MFWIPAWQSQLVQLSVRCFLWHRKWNRWVGGSEAVSGSGNWYHCLWNLMIIFDKQDTKHWCKPLLTTLQHHLALIFNLSKQLSENLITICGFELYMLNALVSSCKTSSARRLLPINLIIMSRFCNLAVNYYHLSKRSFLCEVNAAIDRNCNPAIL